MQQQLNHAAVPPDFSVVLGGPLYQLFIRLRIIRPPLDLIKRRIVVIAALAWVPLLVLAVYGGRAVGGVQVPFLYDVDAHVRFLFSLPLLIAAERIVHHGLRPVVAQFLERGIIRDEQRDRFDAILESSMRLRNSIWAELLLIVVVGTVGQWLWRGQLALQAPTWYADRAETGKLRLTAAGCYYAFVSLPIFQFILLRWYFRIFIWYQFLWRVSRLDLRLIPTHPDGAGGLGFLADSVSALAPILVAQSALLSGMIANRILHSGATLMTFRMEIIGLACILLLLALGPMVFFVRHLMRSRREGMREYGVLSSRYIAEFDQKWLRGGAPAEEPLLGAADIQSLADLSNSVNVIRSMRVFPFGRKAVIGLVVMILLPIAPLALTVFSLEELIKKLLQALL